MYKGYYEKTKTGSASASMRIFNGKCSKKETRPIVGRLIFEENIDSFSGNEGFFAVIRKEGEPTIPSDTRIVGVIWLTDDTTKRSRLPYPIMTLCELPADCAGKIALLDTSAETLFVSPDIFTVNRYTALPTSKNHPRRGLPLTLPNGRRIKIMEAVSSISEISDRGSGYLLDMPASTFRSACSEEQLYEAYRDVAELAVGRSVTVIADTDKYASDRLRAIMRGAVFGNISLAFRGILTEAELRRALERFCKSFCELETEEREFNGYIKRGLIIDTPYLLQIAPQLCGVDFFIYDTDRLVRLLSGERKKAPVEITDRLLDDIRSVIDNRGALCHAAFLGKNTATVAFFQQLSSYGITDCFASDDVIETVTETFGEITSW